MTWAERLGVAVAILSVCVAGDNITFDSYFYGLSEPVYASPIGNGTGDWAEAYSKAREFVSQLTLEEKNNLTYGIPTTSNGCSGVIAGIPRMGFPGMCLQDAGNGVRYTDFVNSYPSGIHIGASWNKSLAYDRAWYMGGRVPDEGRSGRFKSCCAASVEGLQDRGVIASVKHFIAHEQELYSKAVNGVGNYTIEAVSSNIDDKTMHELYLWAFQDAIKAGAGNIMCSYNRVNNSFGCQNSKTMNGLLKTELGFNGFTVSDWDAQHSGVASALAGLDMAMPDGQTYWGNSFTEAYTNGSISVSRLDDMAARIIATWYKMGQDTPTYPAPGVGIPYNISAPHPIVNALDADAKPTLFQGAVEGHVLVKNNDALPLNSPKLLTVFGYDAKAPASYMPNGKVIYRNPWAMGYEPAVSQVEETFETSNFASTMLEQPYDFQVALNGTLTVGGGSGSNTGPYISAPLDALQQRAYEDNTVVMWDTDNGKYMGIMEGSDACLVFINAFASEGVDRANTYDDYSDDLVLKVANSCANTIVVIHNAGVRLVDQFADHPNVTAIIFAHLPGQDSGRALVSLLYGDHNFSGKLPYTDMKNESDYLTYWHVHGVEPYGLFPQANFTEGVYTDYRYFDAHNMTPRYEFGFGLSYTTFVFSDLQALPTQNGLGSYPEGEIEQGGAVDLWDTVAEVTVTVKNTGDTAGAEVVQVYVGIPGGPIKQLRGFEKVHIKPGKSTKVSISLTRRDLSIWDVAAQKWKLQSGSYKIYIGSSSRDLPLVGELHLTTH